LVGTPALAAGTGRSVTLSGFTANAVDGLKAGDLIQISPGRVHLAVDDVTTEALVISPVIAYPGLSAP